MTKVMRRQRLTRRANCTTLALRSSWVRFGFAFGLQVRRDHQRRRHTLGALLRRLGQGFGERRRDRIRHCFRKLPDRRRYGDRVGARLVRHDQRRRFCGRCFRRRFDRRLGRSQIGRGRRRLARRRDRAELRFDLVPKLRRRLDRLDHDVELAKPALPHPHRSGKAGIEREQRLGVLALVGGQRSEHVFGG